MKRIKIWGKIPLDACRTTELTDCLARWAKEKTQKIVFYLNIHQLRLFEENPTYRTALKRADLIYPDGIGAMLAARLSGYKSWGRSTAADFYPQLFKKLAVRQTKIFLLGGKKQVVARSEQIIKRRFVGLKIVGVQDGYFKNNGEVLEVIKRARPEVLIVGMGSPKQEIWVDKNKRKLKAVKLIWAVGGLFNYWTGEWRRAPRWILKLKLEWLFRIVNEPKRLMIRYAKDLASFVGQAITNQTNR